MTKRSVPSMAIVLAVSSKVSPLTTLEVDAVTLITSAPRYLPANSKELRVRVDGSKKRFTTTFPLKSAFFLIGCLITCFIFCASLIISSISLRDISSKPSTSFLLSLKNCTLPFFVSLTNSSGLLHLKKGNKKTSIPCVKKDKRVRQHNGYPLTLLASRGRT